MKAIIDGKFNPKCVEVHGNQIAMYLADNHRLWITCGSDATAESEADGVRRFARVVAEQALGHKLEDYVESEPWHYFRIGINDIYRIRKSDKFAQGYCGGVFVDRPGTGAFSAWKPWNSTELTEAEVINRIGRAALGLPVEAEEKPLDGYWWSDINGLYCRRKDQFLFWYAASGKWVKTAGWCEADCTPATRSSIIEKYGEAPLK